MTERIEHLETKQVGTLPENEVFLLGPAEFLAKRVKEEIAKVSQFNKIFDTSLDSYKRMDYSMRELPALRIYDNGYNKQYDSWFIEGEVFMDVIFPASLRREETQDIPDTISSALLQQFRRTTFFNIMSQKVPGLNELGKTFSVNKEMGFEFEDSWVPLTQIKVNFKIDLRQWDLFLEEQNRTKDDPFIRTLGDLEQIVTVIQGLRDNGDVETTVDIDQEI
jgi:hypothetical protein